VACAVIRRAVAEGHADRRLVTSLDETVRQAMWFPSYKPIRYEPERAHGGRARVVQDVTP